MLQSLSKVYAQLKDGCQTADVKPVCFSPYCRRNVLASKASESESDRALMKLALNKLSASADPASLVCPRDGFIVTRQNLKQLSATELQKRVLNDVDSFCASFGRNLGEDDFKESSGVDKGQE